MTSTFLGAADQGRYQEGSMLVHWPNEPADDGNAIAGVFLAALSGIATMALVVALVMLLR